VQVQSTDGGPPPSILITGETGCGKELVARACHYESPRRDGPFIEVNCAAIPAHLLESELFGHERGAFTDARERKIGLIEAADGGTLFLDEIGEADLAIQAKLLKVLEDQRIRRLGSVQERRVDVRVIAATNQLLEQRVEEGRFRADLLYRLRVIHFIVPPLRARGADIQLLAACFVEQFGRRYGKPALAFTPAALDALSTYSWPGNVRELRNFIEQTVLLAPHERIDATDLSLPQMAPLAAMDATPHGKGGMELASMELDLIRQALEKTGWNITQAARMLGISRDTLRYRMDKHSLTREA
jgi:transcriptional regulator with PAS, ATPase and Fis domain